MNLIACSVSFFPLILSYKSLPSIHHFFLRPTNLYIFQELLPKLQKKRRSISIDLATRTYVVLSNKIKDSFLSGNYQKEVLNFIQMLALYIFKNLRSHISFPMSLIALTRTLPI